MQPLFLFLFTVHAIIMFTVWCLAQLPPSWNIRVDVNQIIGAITMDHNGQRVDAGAWSEVSTTQQFEPSYEDHSTHHETDPTRATHDFNLPCSSVRVECTQNWVNHCTRRKLFLLSQQSTYRGSPARGDPIDELPESQQEQPIERNNGSAMHENDPGSAGLFIPTLSILTKLIHVNQSLFQLTIMAVGRRSEKEGPIKNLPTSVSAWLLMKLFLIIMDHR